MNREYEKISYPDIIEMLNVFLVNMKYRSPHVHNEIEIGLVFNGEIDIIVHERRFTLSSGDIYYLNAMEAHEFFARSSHVLILCLQISPKSLGSYYPDINNSVVKAPVLQKFFTGQEKSYQIIQALCVELAFNCIRRPINYQLKCVSMLNTILYIIFSTAPIQISSPEELARRSLHNTRLKRILDYIDRNFQTKLLLGDIAEKEQLSMTYLSHLFRDTLNITFQDYVNEERFSYACNLLRNTNDKIIDVCLASGFSDVRYMNKMCRKRFGCPAREYRKMQREDDKIHRNNATTQRFLTLAESAILLNKYREEQRKNLENCSIWSLYKDMMEK